MKRLVRITALLFVFTTPVYATDLEIGISTEKPRWGSGFAEATSGWSPTLDIGYLLGDQTRAGVGYTPIDSTFQGFRPPDGDMSSDLVSAYLVRSLSLGTQWEVGGGGGLAYVSHDRNLAEDSIGLLLLGHADLQFTERLAMRLTLRRYFWESESSSIRSPTWSYGVGVAVGF